MPAKMMDLVHVRDGIYDLHNEEVRRNRVVNASPPKTPEEELKDAEAKGFVDGYLQGTKDAVKVVERQIEMADRR